ncbi:CAP domain-containing protein [Paraburkholderia aromaticivorans]|uniref:CAP domain-containing protein n=1 Tax=Paraburkholderia aromaticivorans TaxID=2026199 RepID=UPI0038BC1AE1
MRTKSTFKLTSAAIAAAFFVAACGGGGGGGSSAASPASPASAPSTSTNLTSPQYAADSAQLAAFNVLNQQRQQCGFAALQDNSTLDQAAQAHALYMGQNGAQITDLEVSGNPAFTGVTYADRAVHFAYPQGISVGGVSGGFYTNATLTDTQYGQQLAYGWLSGVYHIGVAVWPVTSIGVGFNKVTYNGFPEVQGTLTIANLQGKLANTPMTFPCQGTTGVAYSTGGETPTPPNTSGNWGTPVAVAANVADTVRLQSGTMTDSAGHVITLQLLDSSNDPNKLLPAYEGVAYPAIPLVANSTYSVAITGTVNGVAFSRTFTFTTGNIVG